MIQRARRGFTLIEVVLTVTLVAIILAIVVPQLGGHGGGDEQARFALSAGLEAQVSYWQEHTAWATPAQLDEVRLPRLSASQGASGDAETVSVFLEAGEVGLAVQGSSACWLAKLDGSTTLWGTTTGACTGEQAIVLAPPESDPSRGVGPNRPIRCGISC